MNTLIRFDCERAERWLLGQRLYRQPPHYEFVGELPREAYEELLDLANYADEWRRQGCSWWRWAVLRVIAAIGGMVTFSKR